MTTTNIISAQSIGTGANLGNFLAAVKTTLQTGTTALLINVRLTLAAQSPNISGRVRVWQAVSPTSYSTAAIGAQAVAQGAEYVELNILSNGSVDIEKRSEILVTAAGYHYCWIEAPTLTVAATVTVNLQELP